LIFRKLEKCWGTTPLSAPPSAAVIHRAKHGCHDSRFKTVATNDLNKIKLVISKTKRTLKTLCF